MKRFLQASSFKKILFLALIVRLLLVPLSFHSDLNTNAIWGIYAREFGLKGYYDWLNFGNYARPEYPPLSTLLFLGASHLWEFLFAIFWKINVSISLFPSNFIPWFETKGLLALLKLPGIVSDLGIGYLIFRFAEKEKNKSVAKIAASMFLFNPAVIYLSASWGQTESLVAFFGLASVITLLNRRYFSSLGGAFASLMIKATMAPMVLVLIIQAIKQKVSPKRIIQLTIGLFIMLFVLGSLFTDSSPALWLIRSYREKFLFGPGNLPFINLNAFNFWGLTLGLERISDNTLFWGVSLYSWAWMISSVFFFLILYLATKERKNIFFVLVVMFFAAFIFLPRMHERYLFPIFVFFPLLLIKKPGLKKPFYILSAVFLINLYHWWWVPNVPPLVAFFDLELIEKGLSLTNLVSFGYLLWNYRLS